MADYIKMDLAGVEALAQKLNGHAERSLADVASLANQANPDDVWNGTAATSYRNAFERWSQAQKEEQEALRNLANAVNALKNNFQTVNAQGASAFNSFYQ